MELTDNISSPYPGASVVLDYCRASFDRRLLTGETAESALRPLEESLETFSAKDSDFKGRVSLVQAEERCYTSEAIGGIRFFPAWLFAEKDAFMQTALKGLRSAGLDPEITNYSFCTNGSHYAGELGLPTLGFGPSREALAHTVDESIETDQLIKAFEGYTAILHSYFNTQERL